MDTQEDYKIPGKCEEDLEHRQVPAAVAGSWSETVWRLGAELWWLKP